MLLTRIVEISSGERFSDFMDKRIFQPLGMTATHVDDDSTRVVRHRATGYAPRTPALLEQARQVGLQVQEEPGYARLIRNSPHFGGSGVFSTVEDLARWDANWYAHRLVGPAFTELMHSRLKFQHPKDNDAFGLVFGDHGGRQALWYEGGDLDASSYMVRLPAQQLTVICLSNMVTGNAGGQAKRVLGVLEVAGRL
ncbi:serine hydrolase domain-containing protein [Hyalangium sp.]|uniref:serine hydrolase domain-containing protein n=1 Tax=Hyalangium sp. TaxID=2028555 RepID=UPI002D75A770|nr:serine hydrolase domain-containing protein [Hyalangium sp.]HYI00459.1 serine hydrolase domain-containing protein [Hyalangium sp.]